MYDGQGNLQWDVLEQVTGVPVLRQDAAELPEGALDEYLAERLFSHCPGEDAEKRQHPLCTADRQRGRDVSVHGSFAEKGTDRAAV